jgi:hypothetical protein
MAGANNEKSFSDSISGIKWLGGYWAASDITDTVSSALMSTTNSKTAAGVADTAVKEATKQSGIKASTDQAKIAAEAAAIME